MSYGEDDGHHGKARGRGIPDNCERAACLLIHYHRGRRNKYQDECAHKFSPNLLNDTPLQTTFKPKKMNKKGIIPFLKHYYSILHLIYKCQMKSEDTNIIAFLLTHNL